MTTNPDALRAYTDLSGRIDALRQRPDCEDPNLILVDAIVPAQQRAELAACLTARATLWASLGLHEDALADDDDALHLYSQIGSTTGAATCLMHRAQCLIALNRPQGALVDIDDAISLVRAEGTAAELARCLQDRARCRSLLNQDERAQEDLAEAQRLLATPATMLPFDPTDLPVRLTA